MTNESYEKWERRTNRESAYIRAGRCPCCGAMVKHNGPQVWCERCDFHIRQGVFDTQKGYCAIYA